MRGLIDISELTIEELDALMDTAEDIIANPHKYSESCKGKKLATLFFEPSTRTRLSFEAAMHELGGSVIGFSDGSNSSAVKGESIADTARVVGCYADIIAMRHFIEGAPFVADRNCVVPVINAGDGGHNHPTQTLADLLTIRREKGDFSHLTVGFCGDLKYGRTVHSLCTALSRYKGVKFVFIAPKELRIPSYLVYEVLEKNGIEYVECDNLDEAMPSLDILYMTRVQGERFEDKAEYERLKDSYILTADKLENAKPDMIIMHPLPRVNEISVEVDYDSRACYFKQVLNGKYMRMALILKLLSEAKQGISADAVRPKPISDDANGAHICQNPKCITHTEQELSQAFKLVDADKNILRCKYCETRVK